MNGALRRRIHEHIDTTAWPKDGMSPVNRVVAIVIFLSIAVVILETEPTIQIPLKEYFEGINLFFAAFFSIEYVVRVWAMGCRPEYAGWRGAIRFMLTPAALIDLIAVAPFFLAFGTNDAFMIRLFRLMRIFLLARLGAFSRAYAILFKAIAKRRFELLVAMSIAVFLLVISATVMYLAEREAQPEAFGSIPRALWWAMATLTTVGYGDIYPVTALGKVFAGLTAVTTIGLIAMPTGILAAAFSDAFQQTSEEDEPEA